MNTKKTLLKIYYLTSLFVVFAMTLGSPLSALAAVWTDKPDYSPGEVVTISGDNSDGAGYLPGETVHVDVAGPNGYTAACEGVAGEAGAWSCQVTLWDSILAVGSYAYTALGLTSGVTQSGTFTDAVGDFSLDLAAAAPYSYNHLTGGGAFDDGTIGKDRDVVESLEAIDFACGDIVTFLTKVSVDDTAGAGTDAPQTIQLDYEFLMDTTGQPGVAIGDIVSVGVNYGTIQDLIPGENTIDDGIVEYNGTPSVATLISETQTAPMFSKGARLKGTIELTGLDRNEDIIVRIDTRLYCKPGTNPTGNLQADLTAARLTHVNGNPLPTPLPVSAGNQTIPFYQFGELHWPELDIQKTVTTANGTCPGTESLNISSGDTVKYCYKVSNPSNTSNPPGAKLYNVTVVDDNGTPADTSDDFTVTLTSGLTDLDGDGQMDDLAAGGIAYGEALVTVTGALGTYINTATAKGYTFPQDTTFPLTDTDTASVVITFVPAPAIDVEKYVSVDGGANWQDADSAPGPYLLSGTDPQFKFVVKNTGNVALSGVTLTDSDFNLSTCTIPATLAVGASFECAITGTWAAGQHTDTANADSTESAADTDDANYYGATPAIDVEKYVSVDGGTTWEDADTAPGPSLLSGTDPQFKFVVTNTGNVTLTGVSLGDSHITTFFDSDLTTPCSIPATLAPAGTFTCYATLAWVAGQHTDTANADSTESAADMDDANYYGAAPALKLVKTASPATYDSVGDVISYSYLVTNSGNIKMAGPVTVTDDKAAVTCPDLNTVGNLDNFLDPGESITCTASYTIAQADLDAGSVKNTAQAHAGGTDSNYDDETVTATQTAELTLDKIASPATYASVGDVISYSYELTNSGNVTLSGPLTVTDDKATATCPDTPTSLAPDASITCTASYTITQADLNAGSVTNTAMGHSFFGDTPVDSNEDSETVTAVQSPALTLDKTVAESGFDSVGDILTYSYKLTNSGNVTLSAPYSVDDNKTTVTCPDTPANLIPGAFVTCSATYVVSQADLDAGFVTNLATGHAFFGETKIDSNQDSTTVNASQAPHLTLDKIASPATYDSVGEVISYSYELTNSGNVTLVAPFTVTDDKATDEACPATPTSLAPGDSITCTASYTITQADLDAGSVTNTAKGHGFFGTTPVDSNEDSETVNAVKNAVLTLTKTDDLNPAEYDHVGQVVTYTLTATNEGNVTLHNVTVSDAPALDNFSCTPAIPLASLAPGATMVCTGTHSITQADLDAGSFLDTGTADSDETAPVDATDTVYAAQSPAPTLVKTGTFDAGLNGYADPGELISYTFKVTNTGNVTLYNISVTDPKVPTITCPSGNPIPSLGVGLSETCTGSYAITQADIDAGFVYNKALASGKGPQDQPVSDDDENNEPLPQNPALELTKTGAWVDGDADGFADLGETINYAFKVCNTGNVTLTNVTVTDPKVTVVGGPTVLDVGECDSPTFTGSYAITQADIDFGSVYNMATADSDESGPDDDDETVTLPQNPAITIDKLTNGFDGLSILVGNPITWTYKVANSGNVTLAPVKVTDDILGEVCSITSLAPGASETCTATGTAVAGQYDNTGTASGKPPVGDNVTASDPSSYFGANPQIDIDKVTNGSDGPALKLGDVITWTYTVTNVGNVPLSNVTVTDSKAGVTPVYKSGDMNQDGILDLTETWIYEATGTVTTAMLADGNPYTNKGTATGSYTDDEGSSRTDSAEDNSSFKAYGLTELLKLTSVGANPPAVDPSMTWTFNIYAGPHLNDASGSGSAWLNSPLASSDTSGDADGILEFSDYQLDPTKTYTICELSVPSGYTVEWKVDTDGDGTPDTVVVPYNPNQKDSVPGDIGNRCFDFGAGTSYTLPANGLLAWQVTNHFPGGEPRTPGYWKNWNRCTGGGQDENADRNGGRDKGFTLLEDILTEPGIIWDDILADNFGPVQITSCEQAVEILDQRVVKINGIVGDGKKLASDAARTLAMHLLAAQLNEGNGACINQDVKDVMLAAEKLLDKYNFDGTKTTAYLTSKSKDYNYALTLARYLDAYNNSACDFTKLPPKPTLQ